MQVWCKLASDFSCVVYYTTTVVPCNGGSKLITGHSLCQSPNVLGNRKESSYRRVLRASWDFPFTVSATSGPQSVVRMYCSQSWNGIWYRFSCHFRGNFEIELGFHFGKHMRCYPPLWVIVLLSVQAMLYPARTISNLFVFLALAPVVPWELVRTTWYRWFVVENLQWITRCTCCRPDFPFSACTPVGALRTFTFITSGFWGKYVRGTSWCIRDYATRHGMSTIVLGASATKWNVESRCLTMKVGLVHPNGRWMQPGLS